MKHGVVGLALSMLAAAWHFDVFARVSEPRELAVCCSAPRSRCTRAACSRAPRAVH